MLSLSYSCFLTVDLYSICSFGLWSLILLIIERHIEAITHVLPDVVQVSEDREAGVEMAPFELHVASLISKVKTAISRREQLPGVLLGTFGLSFFYSIFIVPIWTAISVDKPAHESVYSDEYRVNALIHAACASLALTFLYYIQSGTRKTNQLRSYHEKLVSTQHVLQRAFSSDLFLELQPRLTVVRVESNSESFQNYRVLVAIFADHLEIHTRFEEAGTCQALNFKNFSSCFTLANESHSSSNRLNFLLLQKI